MRELNKEIKKKLRKDKKEHILSTVSKELDVRDNWAGIRALRKEYAPQPYNRKNKKGEIVAQENRAETAAIHLAEEQWGYGEGEEEGKKEEREKLKKEKTIVREKGKYKTSRITMEELNIVVKNINLA